VFVAREDFDFARRYLLVPRGVQAIVPARWPPGFSRVFRCFGTDCKPAVAFE
jgi:hypothetical protein